MKKKSFNLIELITVIAILGTLISLLLPGLQEIQEKTKFAACSVNRDQNYKLIMTAMKDTSTRFPIFAPGGRANPNPPQIGRFVP